MTQPTNQPLRIAVLGMDKQTLKLLEMVFNGPGRGDYTLVEPIDTAEACIFDLDGLDASKIWTNYRTQNSRLPTIILSLNYQDIAGTIFVKKPIEIEKLLKSLNKVKQIKEEAAATGDLPHIVVKSHAAHLLPTQTTREAKLTTEIVLEQEEEVLHQYCGYTADINPEVSAEVDKVYYEPIKYLQGYFEKAFAISQQLDSGGILVEGLYTSMILSPEKNQLLCGCDSTENQLRTMTLLPLSKSSHLRMTTLSEAEIRQRILTDKLTAQPLDNFLWKMALWTARGRVPKGTDLLKNVVLVHWPNFTRLIVTPHALEISALWIAQPHSLVETAKVLDIPQRYVFAFFSAACAIKLAFVDRRQEKRSASGPAASGSDTTKRSLFKRILARLRGQE
jgi:hypothetical protein